MVARLNGVRASVIGARFGWQPHSVRAAISGLRKTRLEVVTSKSAKSAETNYALRQKPNDDAPELNAVSAPEINPTLVKVGDDAQDDLPMVEG